MTIRAVTTPLAMPQQAAGMRLIATRPMMLLVLVCVVLIPMLF
jgi:hypothetical protein